MHDAMVIGGSFAGMAAALQLARARRTVVMIDAGNRRNRFASHSHGFLVQDGDPAAIHAGAKRQLLACSTVRWIDATASGLSGRKDDFRVVTADVELRDGRVLPFAGLFTATWTEPASPLAEAAGCALIETPMGRQVNTGDSKETSLPGIFACGDVARAPHSVSLAVGDGAWAGAQLHRSLVWPEG